MSLTRSRLRSVSPMRLRASSRLRSWGAIPAASSKRVRRAAGCSAELLDVEIAEPDAVSVTLLGVSNSECDSVAALAIDIDVTGGTGPYTYLWSNGVTTQDLSGVGEGTYSVTVTDANSCTGELTGIGVGLLGVSLASVSDVTCNGAGDGAIDITVSGGTSPYSFEWSHSSPAEDPSGLEGGSYAVTVTDNNGCNAELTDIVVAEPVELLVSLVEVHDVSCNEAGDGWINVSVSGGTGSFGYMWSNGATTQDLTGLDGGTYSVTVTDANDCTDELEQEVLEPDILAVTVDAVTHLECYGDGSGAIEITPSGGTPDYTFLWSNGASVEDPTVLDAGTFSVTVSDSNGCTVTESGIETTEPDDIVITLFGKTDLDCAGDGDGAIDITVTGGTGSYGYDWRIGTAPDDTFATTQDLSTLDGGTYSITVSDERACSAVDAYGVNEPDELTSSFNITHVACNGDQTGSIDISPSGGTGSLTFDWSNSTHDEDLGAVFAGTYSVTITDENLCTFSLSDLVVTEPDTLAIGVPVVTNITCNGALEGEIDITVSGGTLDYTFDWQDTEGSVSTEEDLSSVGAGSYSVGVMDANDCAAELVDIEITEPSAIQITIEPDTDVSHPTCNGDDNGWITPTVTGGVGSYSYLWAPSGSTSRDIFNLSPNSYQLTVTDDNACSVSSESVSIEEPAVLEVALASSITHVACHGDDNGQIDISVSGGTAPYEFDWSNGATTEDVTGLAPSTYSVDVTDTNSCTDDLTGLVVTEPAELTATITNVIRACDDINGEAHASPSGGTQPYAHLWSTGYSGGPDLTGVIPGTYWYRVTDENDCSYQVNDIQIVGDTIDLNGDGHSDCLTNRLTNPHFDGDVAGWSASTPYSYSTDDGLGDVSGYSGSFEVEHDIVSGSTSYTSVGQCILVTGGEELAAFFQYYVPPGQEIEPGEPIEGLVKLYVYFFESTNCMGGATYPLQTAQGFVIDSWTTLAFTPFTVDAGRNSGRIFAWIEKEPTSEHLRVRLDNFFLGSPPD